MKEGSGTPAVREFTEQLLCANTMFQAQLQGDGGYLLPVGGTGVGLIHGAESIVEGADLGGDITEVAGDHYTFHK